MAEQGLTTIIDIDVFDAMIELAEEIPAMVLAYARKDIQKQVDLELLDQNLRLEPPEPTYTVDLETGEFKRFPSMRWTSPLQQRAFFASDGFGGGLPYERSHTLAPAWTSYVVWDRDTIVIGVDNPSPVTPYVYGPWQQIFHADMGWPDAEEQVLLYSETIQDALIDFYLRAFEILGR